MKHHLVGKTTNQTCLLSLKRKDKKRLSYKSKTEENPLKQNHNCIGHWVG